MDSAEPVETRLPGSIHGLNVYDMLYIGGHPDMPMLKVVKSLFRIIILAIASTYVMQLNVMQTLCPLHISRSDAPIGLESGQSHPTSRRDPIHICRMTRNAYIRVGWYGEGVIFIITPSERQLHCTRSAPDQPMASGNVKHV